jgi:MFS family permease
VVALLMANAISLAGNVFALIAIPWFVLQTTHRPAKAGITGFFITLGSVLAAFFGGAIVDRLGFKRTSIAADLASGVAVALIPLLYAMVGLQYWQLLVLVFVGNLLDAPGTKAARPARQKAKPIGKGRKRASTGGRPAHVRA